MTEHVSWQELVDYVEEKLDEGFADSVEAHLAQCEACAGQADWLHETLLLLGTPRFPAVPDSARAAALAAFDQEQLVPYPTTPLPLPWYRRASRYRPLAVLAAVMVVTLLFWQSQRAAFAPPLAAGTVQEVVGDVQVFHQEGTVEPASPNMPLAAGDFITTGLASAVTLALGKAGSQVTLAENSNLGISEASGLQLVLMTDTAGEVSIEARDEHPVTLNIPYATVTCRQGAFLVRYLDADHGIEVAAKEGRVRVVNEQGSAELTGGQRVILYEGAPPGGPPPKDHHD